MENLGPTPFRKGSTTAGLKITRRGLLAGLTVCCSGRGIPFPQQALEASEHSVAKVVSAADALEQLKAGNRRFMEEHATHGHANRDWRRSLVGSQHPFAVVVGCSDSRVPPELIFDQGFGDLFIVRNAGNLIATDVVASIEYAIVHLQTPLVVILGHEGCGAVTASLESREARDREPIELQAVLQMIAVAVSESSLPSDPKKRVSAAVELNVRWGLKQLKYLVAERRLASPSSVIFAGGIYDLQTGSVRFIV